mgnify:CR=1 FL=1
MLVSFLITGCEKEQPAAFNMQHLTDTTWGAIYIEEVGPYNQNFEQYSSIKFNADGTVLFNEVQTDFWKVYTSKSILIQEKSQIWQIIELNQDTLHVEKYDHPSFEFIVRGYYTPIQKK